ncbi:hypothetical protein [Mycobacterium sp. NPDC050853]|uniref:hypothetical protein n=1 Tax=Mycobacteriaceae TaxID=1762 RepID=UPI0015DE53A2|nr:hypothetical protein [Mycobacteroides sp. LB1]
MSAVRGYRMADLVGGGVSSAEFTPVGDGRFRLGVNDEDGYVTIEFVEPLALHAECMPEVWPTVIDSDGYLTREAAKRVAERLHKLLPLPNDGVEHTDRLEHESEPTLGLSIYSPYRRDETFGSWFDRIGRQLITSVVNLTEPQAGQSPYLFRVLDNR